MTISKLIERLEKIKSVRGDLEVRVYDDWDCFPIDRISASYDDPFIVIQGEHGGWSREDDA